MDVPRGSCGVELMTPGVVASEGMLYQEADRGPATPVLVLARHPYTSSAAFGPSMGHVGYDHRMDVTLDGREVDPRVKGVTVECRV